MPPPAMRISGAALPAISETSGFAGLENPVTAEAQRRRAYAENGAEHLR
jgi:hypothetical protein